MVLSSMMGRKVVRLPVASRATARICPGFTGPGTLVRTWSLRAMTEYSRARLESRLGSANFWSPSSPLPVITPLGASDALSPPPSWPGRVIRPSGKPFCVTRMFETPRQVSLPRRSSPGTLNAARKASTAPMSTPTTITVRCFQTIRAWWFRFMEREVARRRP